MNAVFEGWSVMILAISAAVPLVLWWVAARPMTPRWLKVALLTLVSTWVLILTWNLAMA